MFVSTRYNYCKPLHITSDLRQLLELNIDSNLWKYFGMENVNSEEKAPKLQLTEKVISTINACNLFFEKCLKEADLSPTKLRPCYELARKILREAKTILLEHKLIEENIDPVEVHSHFDQLNETIAQVYLTYENVDFAYPLPSSPQIALSAECTKFLPQLPQGNRTPFSALPSTSFAASFPYIKYIIEKERAEKLFQENWLQRNTLKRFLEMTPLADALNWHHRLKEAIASLKFPQEFYPVAKILQPIQVIEILSSCSLSSELSNKLPYILTSLNDNVFQEVLLSLYHDEETLSSLNATLRKITQEDKEIRRWIEIEFYTIRQTFVDILNNACNAIDMLSKRFRDHIFVHRITQEDLKDIDDLLENIEQNYRTAQTLQKLFQGILKDPETLKVLNEIDEAYEEAIARLQQDSDSSQNVKARIYDIIDRNTFFSEGYQLDDDAFECFALWHLTTEESLWQNGLLGNVSKEEFDQMKSEQSLKDLYKVAMETLNQAGIYQLTDFRRLRIYNLQLLKDFLKNLEPAKT